MVNSEDDHKRFLNIEIARILLAFCSGFTTDVDLSLDIISVVSGYVRSYILKRDEKKRPLCIDIKMLMYSDNPSIGCDNSDHKFSFLECLNFACGYYEPTIEDFISYKNVRRRLAPLDTKTNKYFENRNTAIDVINLIRRALNGEISYYLDESDPGWHSCNLELYNVDTRYFTFYRDENNPNADSRDENSLGTLYGAFLSEQAKASSRLDCYINLAGFIWVPSPTSAEEYGRLFFKPDSHVCEGFWEKTLCENLEYVPY